MPLPLHYMPEKCGKNRYVVMQIATTLRQDGANAVEVVKERVSQRELHI